jgi:hypothetical protein
MRSVTEGTGRVVLTGRVGKEELRVGEEKYMGGGECSQEVSFDGTSGSESVEPCRCSGQQAEKRE